MEFDRAEVAKERAAGAMAGRAESKKDPYGASHEKKPSDIAFSNIFRTFAPPKRFVP